MKRFLRVLIPILLTLVIIACSFWYLFVYDREFTRDILLSCARKSEEVGYHDMATWFYNRAYAHDGNSDAVAIELAQQYIDNGNYTKAEYTLSNAISDGGGVDVYVKLCKTFVEQDKLIDAVKMLDSVINPQIKAELDKMRPSVPIFTPDPTQSEDEESGSEGQSEIQNLKEYDQYISVSLSTNSGNVYATTDGTYPSTSMPYTNAYTMQAGTNTVRALVINDKGLVSRLEERKYLIHGVVEEVVFTDSAIEASIRELLGIPESKKILTSDLWTIKDFTIPAEATNYDDVHHMIYLESLTIDAGISGQLASICPDTMDRLQTLTIRDTEVSQDELKLIAKIPDLQELTLNSTGLSGISPLKDATKLVKLDISSNSVGVLDTLKYFTQLQELNLRDNAVTDLSALSKNTHLRVLDVSLNQIVTLAPITSLTNLTHLIAAENRISVLGDIGKLTELNVLNLSSNLLTSLSTIHACTDITDLTIKQNQLVDISAISSMQQLAHLDFSNNLVTMLPEFSESSALVTIDGSFNMISDLSQLSGLKKLNTVNMESNLEITSLEPLASCRNLFRVNVLDTKVTEVRVLTDKSISVLYRVPEINTEETP